MKSVCECCVGKVCVEGRRCLLGGTCFSYLPWNFGTIIEYVRRINALIYCFIRKSLVLESYHVLCYVFTYSHVVTKHRSCELYINSVRGAARSWCDVNRNKLMNLAENGISSYCLAIIQNEDDFYACVLFYT